MDDAERAAEREHWAQKKREQRANKKTKQAAAEVEGIAKLEQFFKKE
jgi:hypothetical protein